jgi:hypothetical protein
MADVFGFSTTGAKGVFWSKEASFTIGDGGHIALIQNWSIDYSQNIQPIYEVGSDAVYYAKKHAAGTLQVSRIISDKPLLEYFGDGCTTKTCTIRATTGLCKGTSNGDTLTSKETSKLVLHGTVLVGIKYSGSNEQAYVSEDVSCMFAALETDNN